MVFQIKISSAVYPFYFSESHREIKFYIAGGICIVSKFNMVVEAVFFSRNSQSEVPFHSFFLPVFIPFFLRTRLNKELHFHLLKFTHAKDKLTSNNFISECFSSLCNSERYFHSTCFLHIQEVHKNSLSSFWS